MGFRNYISQPGDTLDAVKGAIGFLADCVWSSKTVRLCLAMAAATTLILATTKEEERLDSAPEVPGTGLLGSTLQYLLDPHRQFREMQNTEGRGE